MTVGEARRAVDAPTSDPVATTAVTRRASRRRIGVRILVGVVLAASIALRFATRSDLWLDETLGVNYARLPISDLFHALRKDGSPPLYFMVLHVWMKVFGIGDLGARSMSAFFSILTLPAAYLAGRRLGGTRLAWAAVLVFATSPFAIRYATEARPYALEMFLVLWGYLAVRRAEHRPSFGRLAIVAVVTAVLAYTQYWALYLIAAAGLCFVVLAWRAPSAAQRQAFRRLLVAVALGCLTFVAWVPTFRFQMERTGTPWGDPRSIWSGVNETLISFSGRVVHAEYWFLYVALILLPLLALFGRARDERNIDLDLRTVPGVRPEALVGYGALVLGLGLSWLAGSAFEGRYAAVVFPLVAIVVVYGLTTFADRRLFAGALVFLVCFGLIGGLRNYDDNRTQAAMVARVIASEGRPGDVVVYCPDQIAPAVARLLRDDARGIEQLTFPDAARPEFVNWIDYKRRVASGDVDAFARSAVGRAGDHTVWFVWAFGYGGVGNQCERLSAALAGLRPGAGRVAADPIEFYEYQGLTEFRAP